MKRVQGKSSRAVTWAAESQVLWTQLNLKSGKLAAKLLILLMIVFIDQSGIRSEQDSASKQQLASPSNKTPTLLDS